MPKSSSNKSKVSASASKIELGKGFFRIEGTIQASQSFFDRAGRIDLQISSASGLQYRAPIGLHENPDHSSAHLSARPTKAFQALVICETSPRDFLVSLLTPSETLAVNTSATTVEEFTPRGKIDRLDALNIGGWLFDPGLQLSGTKAFLQVGAWLALPLVLDQDRPDIAFHRPEQASPYGFQISIADLVRQLRGLNPDFVLGESQALDLKILSADRVVDRCSWTHYVQTEGRLEKLENGLVRGWAIDLNQNDTPVNVELYIDGVRFREVTAGERRGDLISKGISKSGGGFSIDLPIIGIHEAAELGISVKRAQHDKEIARASLKREALPRRVISRRTLLSNLRSTEAASDQKPITVIIPIYNAPDEVARCIDSVVNGTFLPCHLLLIDDASPDPRINEVLSQWDGWPNVKIHRNKRNLGYTRTVNLGLSLATDTDVVLLNSDTIVSKGWLQSLRLAAYSDNRIATATAVSNNAGAFSAPEFGVDNAIPESLNIDDLGRLLRHSSLTLTPIVPTGNGFCMFMRRSCIKDIGVFDEAAFPRGYGEENDFSMRALRAGYINVVDDRTYVFHKRSASFGSEKDALNESGRNVVLDRYPEYTKLTGVFQNDLEFVSLRWHFRRALHHAGRTGKAPKPRILFVISTQTGGTPQTNQDLMDALSDRYEPWVLRCDSRILELSKFSDGRSVSVEMQALSRPIQFSLHQSEDYDERVADLLIRYAFELVHIRHIGWHSLGLPAVCRLLAIPVVFSFHDFYTVCPTVKLLDENQRFCGGRCTSTTGECTADLWPASSIPPLKHRFIHRWQELMGKMLNNCDAFVTTSPVARKTLLSTFPSLRQRKFPVIPHGRSFEKMRRVAATFSGKKRLRVLVPGNISAAKGAKLFNAIAKLDLKNEFEFHFLGDSGVVEASDNVLLHGRYHRHEFADRVAEIEPHIGVIFSIWPETYCHTLTEMWACGIPTAAFDIGAVGERLRTHGGGWLLSPDSEPAQILKFLQNLRLKRTDLVTRYKEVLNWQDSYGKHYDTHAMAVEYDSLYRQVFESRRSFGNPAKEGYRFGYSVLLVAPDSAEAWDELETIIHDYDNEPDASLIFRRTTPSGVLTQLPVSKPSAVVILAPPTSLSEATALLRYCQSENIPLILDLRASSEVMGVSKGTAGSKVMGALMGSSVLIVVSHQHQARNLTGLLPQQRVFEAPEPHSIFGLRSKTEKQPLLEAIKRLIDNQATAQKRSRRAQAYKAPKLPSKL